MNIVYEHSFARLTIWNKNGEFCPLHFDRKWKKESGSSKNSRASILKNMFKFLYQQSEQIAIPYVELEM